MVITSAQAGKMYQLHLMANFLWFAERKNKLVVKKNLSYKSFVSINKKQIGSQKDCPCAS
jgi:hypothetical protein